MICAFCRENILESRSGRTWGFHHQDPNKFKASSLEGCSFCARLIAHLELADLDISKSWSTRADPGKSIYRWSVRKAASMSESHDCVAISFRSLPAREDAGDYLPDETFYLLPEKGTSALPFPDELGGSTASDQSWAQIRRWLEICVGEHPDCHRSEPELNLYPKRLVDIGTDLVKWPPELVRIVSAKEVNLGDVLQRRYATLSHSWGPDPSFAKLTKDNFEKWTHMGISWSEVSSNENFAQAMKATWLLGVRYIWIDSLCIIQHDPDDWEEEAPMMRDIYRNSYCNIAASDSMDSQGGLFRSRSGGRIAAAVYEGQSGKSIPMLAGQTWRVLPGSLWQNDLMGSPLYQRGWVFQERMLAPRMLHFAKEQIFWDCASTSACECLPAGLPQQLDNIARIDRRWRNWLRAPKTFQHMDVDTFWSSAVLTYTSCNLTYHKDKLKAIYGVGYIVDEIQKQNWGTWEAGLWSSRLEDQLIWTVVRPDNATRPDLEPGDTSRFPSWSWLSVRGAVHLPRLWAPVPFYVVENHAGGCISFPATSKDTENKCRSTRLEMRCHVGRAILRNEKAHKRMILDIDGTDRDVESFIQVFPDTVLDFDKAHTFLLLVVSKEPAKLRTSDGRVVTRAFIDNTPYTEFSYSGFGLLIKEEKDRAHHYVRTGVIKFSELNQCHWLSVQQACGDFDGLSRELKPPSISAKNIWLE